ncbi:sulfotransferase [Oleiagrimonas sp. MCCC 1A03011]|uniref:sulfotransferase family protein n=1 Tax=Oleiagrimonas sp. MCCC 1A03011 TaxID=1926883 RepID=UPI000DC604F3|nr:sulfotransferase [Oleiagrimonas sp. MCCC 1A03011]RAP59381.1 hypothetical protein BTJ49_01570 [Oleiagrimonas sp. MCCC 1A03011]
MNIQIIGIHGAPRSGTSWVGEIFNSSPQTAYRYQPLFAYAFRDRIDVDSDAAEVRSWLDDLLHTRDEFVLQTGAARLARRGTQFTKTSTTHLVYKEVRFHHLIEHLLDAIPGARYVGLIRDPRDVIASWSMAPREFDLAWSLDGEWRLAAHKNAGLGENWYGFERWKELAELFLRLSEKYPNRFRLVRYEDLVLDPEPIIRNLFSFCEIDFKNQTKRFLARSTSEDDSDPYGVFRNTSNRFQYKLPPHIAEAIVQELSDTPLAPFLDPANH